MSFLRPQEDELALEAALAFVDEYQDTDEEPPTAHSDVESRALEPDFEPLANANNTNEPKSPNAGNGCGASLDAHREPPQVRPERMRTSQKEELIYLRCRVSELEDRLARLQNKRNGASAPPRSPTLSSTTSTSQSSGGDGDETSLQPLTASLSPFVTKPSAQLAAVWQKVAARQYEQREHAEVENAKLKEMLKEQIHVARSLERVLQRRTNGELLTSFKPSSSFSWDHMPSKGEETAMFQEMLKGLEQQYSDAPSIFSSSRFPLSRGAIFCDVNVRMKGENSENERDERDTGLIYIEAVESKIFPFDLQSTAAAFWQEKTHGDSIMKSMVRENFEVTDDTLARSFRVEITEGPVRGEFRGKQCMRRYQGENRTVIVLTLLVEPREASRTFMGGLLMRQKAWLELTPSAEDPIQATQVRARYIVAPDVYNDEAATRERKVGAVTDFMLHVTRRKLNSSDQNVENILVQSMLQNSSV